LIHVLNDYLRTYLLIYFVFSPFKTRILPSFDASKVVVSGDGVRPRGVLASIPTSFLIDTREAGLADLDVVIQVRNAFVVNFITTAAS